ncbi:MAG: CoA transferase [Chloroflexi bacterium]|nr:CoA transferase [Chloroflexota bacterium]
MMLSGNRALDVTDYKGWLSGRILADLGVDVIKVEPPGGDPGRSQGPFYGGKANPERSLSWFAYNLGKRGITLNLEATEGAEIFKRLARNADFVLESFRPGYLDGLGLGYQHLAEINPKLVMVSITPFGQDGPYSNYQATDIVGMALGGFMYLTGDEDRAPIRISFPHFYLHGGAAGATAAMLAHTYRVTSGQGQYVDVSCQQAVAKTLAHAPQMWDIEGVILKRMGVFRQTSGENRVRINWPCKDGYVNYMVQGGTVAYSTRALLDWMKEDGFDIAELAAVDWEEMGYGAITPELTAKLGGPLGDFFNGHTRAELVQGSLDRRILLFPVATPSALQGHPQLEARGFFKELDHPELGVAVQYPGAFIKSGDGGDIAGLYRRPPLIGEHNADIFQGELGLSGAELDSLKRSGVI